VAMILKFKETSKVTLVGGGGGGSVEGGLEGAERSLAVVYNGCSLWVINACVTIPLTCERRRSSEHP
jgi:hypothetical protein